MYQISNRERDDLIKVLTALREEVETGADTRKMNIKRVAGLLIRKLEKKQKQ